MVKTLHIPLRTNDNPLLADYHYDNQFKWLVYSVTIIDIPL
jgi:hypothetical protein